MPLGKRMKIVQWKYLSCWNWYPLLLGSPERGMGEVRLTVEALVATVAVADAPRNRAESPANGISIGRVPIVSRKAWVVRLRLTSNSQLVNVNSFNRSMNHEPFTTVGPAVASSDFITVRTLE